MKKVLVVGSSGLLGSRIIEIGRNGYEMFGTYSKHNTMAENSYHLDSLVREQVFTVIKEMNPDFVIDTHAITNLDYCEIHKEEAWEVNVEGAKNIAEASESVGAKYVFLSTDNVFDGTKETYVEMDKTHPLNQYGKTKVAVEEMLENSGVDFVVIRTAVLYGIGGIGKPSFATWLISKLRNGEEVKVVTDQESNPTFVDSLAELVLSLCEKDEKGIFHVAGKDCLSRYEFSLQIAESFGFDKDMIVPVSSSELGQMAKRPKRVNLGIGKVKKATGMNILGIKEGIDMFRKQIVMQ